MIGLNVLGYTVQDVPGLIDWLTTARPDYTLVMDDLDLAARIAMTGTQVIFRRYRPDDQNLPAVMTPTDFLNSIADIPQAYIVQAGNEPGGDQAALVEWTAELIAQANIRRRRLEVGNWSVGNPDEEQVRGGLYDPILKALAGSQHILGLHEYFHDAPAQEPYFVGRYRHFLQRADALAIPWPEVVISEHGRDLGGGNDGWRAQGWTDAQYAKRLEDAQSIYRPDGITALVFCYGRGFTDRWQTYNVEGATALLEAMAGMNYYGPPGWAKVKTKAPGVRVNVRNGPSLQAPVITTVQTGDWLKPVGGLYHNQGHTWQKVQTEACETGHVSMNVIELE